MDIKAPDNIIYTSPAIQDITNIYDYIFSVSCSREVADRFVERISDSINSLDFMPERYHLYPNNPWHSLGVRYFISGKYKIFYIYNKDDDKVKILRVFHSSQNYEEELNLYNADMVADSNSIAEEYEKAIRELEKEKGR